MYLYWVEGRREDNIFKHNKILASFYERKILKLY